MFSVRHLLTVVLLFLLASGCAKEPEPLVLPDPPTADQLREDLVGARFAFFADADGPRYWTIEPNEIRRLDVVDQALDDSGRVARSRVSLLLRAEQRDIRGDLIVRHLRQGPNWVLEEVGRAGPNWKAGDARAMLFAVDVVADSTERFRSLVLSPIARYEGGRYIAPLAEFYAPARALFDSTFANDSLRAAAEDALARRASGEIAPRGGAIWILGPGKAPARVRIDSTQASLVGCEYVSAFATPPTPEAAGWAELATTSSVMGTPLADGGPVSRELARALDGVARERFEISGADASRMRQRRAIAADLDGDGQDEAVGVFTLGEGERRQSLAVAVERGSTTPRLLFERRPARADGYTSLSLVGVLDVDADGAAEVIFEETGYEVYRYLIVTFRAGRFTDAFRGGGGGC